MDTKHFESIQLDLDIRRLLVANPSIGTKTSKGIISALQYSSNDQKKELRKWLRENLAVFKKKTKEYDTPALQMKLYEQVNKHIDQWEEEFGEVSLSDLHLLTVQTDIKLVDIGWRLGKISPASIAKLLDEYIVGQEPFKQAIGQTLDNHIARMHYPDKNLPKENQLSFGSSGTGKTSGVIIPADLLNINWGIVNCERVQPEGIQGPKLSDPCVRALGNKEDNMIMIFDEVDKIKNEEVRNELLSYLDDKNMISFPTTFGVYREYREIPSGNITCILCGKFEALTEAVKKRLNMNRVGFSAGDQKNLSIEELYALVNMDDLKQVLGSEELCGRIGNFVGLRPLNADDLVTIMLYKKESIFSRYNAYFSIRNAKLELTMDGAQEIADITIKKYKDLGARGLEIVIRQLLKEPMFNIDKFRGKCITIDKGYVTTQLKDIITN